MPGGPSAHLERCRIASLNPNRSNIYVLAQLIAMSDVHLFHNRSSSSGSSAPEQTNSDHQHTDTPRGVLTLTLRDAEHAFVNCTVWGTAAYCTDLAARLHLADVLSVQRPKVDAAKPTATAYNPLTPSPYQLTVNERQMDAFIVPATADERSENAGIDQWLGVPVKPTRAALRLSDCGSGAPSAAGDRLVDLVVVVQKMWPTTTIGGGGGGPNTGRRAGERLMRKVDVLDESCSGVRLTIWNAAFVKR